MTPGTHGSTFGGNPVACAAALAVIDALEQDGVMENAAEIGGYLIDRLREIGKTTGNVREVRGKGMIIGAALTHPAKSVVDECLKEHLLVNGTAEHRVAPAAAVEPDARGGGRGTGDYRARAADHGGGGQSGLSRMRIKPAAAR